MAGDDLRVTVTGLAGHQEVEVGIASVYVRLGTAAVSDGTAVTTVRVPADLQPGTHEVQARADGVVLARAEVLVLEPDVLAETGSASRTVAVAALGLAALGALLLAARRRAALLTVSPH
jgi:LPXTG-motif cell wall-anchored protein